MNLNTVTGVKRPRSVDEIQGWRAGNAWLAGGTWLFSEPQIHTDTLIDLELLGWPSLTVTEDGLEVGATCRIAEFYASKHPSLDRGNLVPRVLPLVSLVVQDLDEATIGGDIVMSLPAGPMISLTVALEAEYELWPREGPSRTVLGADLSREYIKTFLGPASCYALSAFRFRRCKRHAFRRASLTHLGRSSVLLIGTRGDREILLTVSAATVRPIQLQLGNALPAAQLRDMIDAAIPGDLYLDDVHGSPAHRRHLTYHFAQEICEELASS